MAEEYGAGTKVNIEDILKSGKSVQMKPQGYSMYPLFMPGRDWAVISPVEDTEKLKKGDVVLYRRDGSILVLHRIYRHDSTGFYMVGDNQKEIEGPLRPDQIRGILVAIIRKGKHISTDNLFYRFLFGVWLIMRPVRPAVAKAVAFVKKRFTDKP